MYITDEKWEEICTAAKTGIDKRNAQAAERQRLEVFSFEVETGPNFAVIITRHRTERGPAEIKALARERTTGHIRSSKFISKKGQPVGLQIQLSDPKAWNTLAAKPAAEIVKQMKLLNFIA